MLGMSFSAANSLCIYLICGMARVFLLRRTILSILDSLRCHNCALYGDECSLCQNMSRYLYNLLLRLIYSHEHRKSMFATERP